MESASAIYEKRKLNSLRIAVICCFIVYLATVCWYTVGRRSVGYYTVQADLFWSYRQWLEGNWDCGRAILANIAMFLPFGFLVGNMREGAEKNAPLFVFLLSLAFSSLIETAQYMLMRGMFEFDDICNNVAGALLGWTIYWSARRFLPEKLFRPAMLCAGAGIIVFCFGLFFQSHGEEYGAMLPLSRGLCFQIEDASVRDGRLEIDGVCFWYDRKLDRYTLFLQSTETGKRHPLQTEYGLPRRDVDAYFGMDGLKAGFHAIDDGIEAGREYEVVLDFGFLRAVHTGVYITVGQADETGSADQSGVSVHDVSDAVFQPLKSDGTDLEEIVSSGVLRVYRPDHHIYVYWYQGKFYWIAEDGFQFEDDGTTHLELALWTTQPEKLPQKMRDEGVLYQSIGLYFERYELEGNFGPYRVCANELHVDYPITAVKAGCYDGGWTWENIFWPVFDFTR